MRFECGVKNVPAIGWIKWVNLSLLLFGIMQMFHVEPKNEMRNKYFYVKYIKQAAVEYN